MVLESEKLKAENAALKSQVEKLESENNKLRETAQYHFRLAQDHIAAKNWSEAIASLQTVITKYPNDALVGPARESLSWRCKHVIWNVQGLPSKNG